MEGIRIRSNQKTTSIAWTPLFIFALWVAPVSGEGINVTDKTGVDVLCKGRGAYTGPTTLSNYSTCMFNDGSMLECNNKTDQCTSKPAPKAKLPNSPKTAPQLQLRPAPGAVGQSK